jgi:hypothetical protein
LEWYCPSPRSFFILFLLFFICFFYVMLINFIISYPTQGQSAMTLFVVTSGMWYQNSGFTASPFSERVDGFLTWGDIVNGKLGNYVCKNLIYIYFLFFCVCCELIIIYRDNRLNSSDGGTS